MFYKIFYGDKPIFLCDKIEDHLQPFVHHDDTVFIDELNTHTLNTLVHEMKEPKVHSIVFYHPDLELLRDKVFKQFKLIRAGGGLVLNGSDAVLLIYRRKKWDLPKGKLDKNESIKNCAIREVEEETGLTNVKLNKHLCTTWHIYPEGSKFMLKETDWFQMKVKGQPSLLPQAEEGIEVAKWVTKKELPEYLKNTFPSVRDVLSLL